MAHSRGGEVLVLARQFQESGILRYDGGEDYCPEFDVVGQGAFPFLFPVIGLDGRLHDFMVEILQYGIKLFDRGSPFADKFADGDVG